jgi:hypothetical protein
MTKFNSAIRILINIIIGVLLFQMIFGLVFYGSAAGAIQSLVVIAVKMIKLIMVLAVLTGILLVFKKSFARKGEDGPMNFNKEQIIKGVILGILALIAFGLLSNLFGGPGGYAGPAGPGYAGDGGGEGAYGYTGGYGVTGLVSSILSMLITLMSVALVVFLALGAYKAAEPYLKTEFGSLFNTPPKNKCAKCGKKLADDWKVCPICGDSTPQPETLPELVPAGVTETAAAIEQDAAQEGAATTSSVVDQEPVSETPAEATAPFDRTSADKPAHNPTSKKNDKKKNK